MCWTLAIEQYGPLNSLEAPIWKGLSIDELKDEKFPYWGLHMSPWPCDGNSFGDEETEIREEA
jgi:hypothetical protein